MAGIFFLGSDRLPHCDKIRKYPQPDCPDEYYYSGETIRFLVDIGPFAALSASYDDGNGNYSSCSGLYYSPEDPRYYEGMHPPIVYGQPKIKFNLTSLAGPQIRYATLNTILSVVPQGYLVYDYTIQTTDAKSTINVQNSIAATDLENRISYWYGCTSGSLSGGSQFSGSSADFDQYTLDTAFYGGGVVYPDVTNVRINYDSGSVTENQTRILLKRSSVADKVPTTSDLLLGEAAVNTTDGKIFLKKGDDSIVQIKPLEPQDFDTLSATISGDTNDLDLGIKALTRLTVSADGLKISGFKAGKDGEIKMVYNSGSYTVKILNESLNSSAANRVAVYNSADFDLPSRSGVTIVYDGTSGVWRLF